MRSVTKRVYAIDFSLAILGYILFVCMDTIAKDLVERYHVAQIIFVSGISALLPVLLYTQARNSWNKIGKANYKVHFFRTLTMFLAMATFFYCSNYLPLTTLYSIIFTAPFLLTIGAVIFLKEQVSWRRYTAIIIGFFGAVIAINPFGDGFNKIVFLAMLTPVFASASYLIVRKYGHQETIYSFLIYGKLLMILFSGIIAFKYFKPMTSIDLFYNFNAGLLRGMAIIFVINSARHLPSSIFASAQYIQIVAGGILGYLVFKDIPGLNVYAGSLIIILSGLYIIFRESKLSVNIVSSTTRHPSIPLKKD